MTMKRKLGEILVTSGTVSGADVQRAISDQTAGEPSRLGDLLVATGKLSSAQLASALAAQYGLPYVELPSLARPVLDLVPLDLQRQFRFVPLKSEANELSIAMADLANIEVLAILEQQWAKVHVNVAGGDEIDALLAACSGVIPAPPEGQGNPDEEASPAPSTGDDPFGSFDLQPVAAVPHPSGILGPSPVPVIAPVQPEDVHLRASLLAHSGSPPRAEDLFGDLNLESARTGIRAKLPEDFLADPVEAPPDGSSQAESQLDSQAGPVQESPPSESAGSEVKETLSESSGPVLLGVREGTGPLLDLLAKEGVTGPVVDTPFFREAPAAQVVPAVSDEPFVSNPPSLPGPQTGTAAEVEAAAPGGSPSPGGASLFDPPPHQTLATMILAAMDPQPSGGSPAWSGALDHLMPSKLVVGLTRALLARGLVTEEEILKALGQSK